MIAADGVHDDQRRVLGALDRPEDDLQAVGEPEPLDPALRRRRGGRLVRRGLGVGAVPRPSCRAGRGRRGSDERPDAGRGEGDGRQGGRGELELEEDMERSTPFVNEAAPAEDAPAAIAWPAASFVAAPSVRFISSTGTACADSAASVAARRPAEARPRGGPVATGAARGPATAGS